jgi:hypothetical protein
MRATKEKKMKTNEAKWVVKAAGAGALVVMLATPTFAQSAGQWRGNHDTNRSDGRQQAAQDNRGGNRGGSDDRGAQNRAADYRGPDNRSRQGSSYRENQRINVQGQVTSFSRERDGYRVQLDRGRDSYYVPGSYFRDRGRDLRAGISIALGGVFRGGAINIDAVSWPGEAYGRGGYGYSEDVVLGTVERVDYRRNIATVRDDRTGRFIDVAMSQDRYGRSAADTLRRGERVELTGAWTRGGVFEANRIDPVGYRR